MTAPGSLATRLMITSVVTCRVLSRVSHSFPLTILNRPPPRAQTQGASSLKYTLRICTGGGRGEGAEGEAVQLAVVGRNGSAFLRRLPVLPEESATSARLFDRGNYDTARRVPSPAGWLWAHSPPQVLPLNRPLPGRPWLIAISAAASVPPPWSQLQRGAGDHPTRASLRLTPFSASRQRLPLTCCACGIRTSLPSLPLSPLSPRFPSVPSVPSALRPSAPLSPPGPVSAGHL